MYKSAENQNLERVLAHPQNPMFREEVNGGVPLEPTQADPCRL